MPIQAANSLDEIISRVEILKKATVVGGASLIILGYSLVAPYNSLREAYNHYKESLRSEIHNLSQVPFNALNP